ncbi:NADPH-dependent ferric siderophore reductase, contains FAD-binding and SIP domains [Sulfitobacter marinus]|uniref:NADPH-dependent ferric siderophore reductase, contains FAD-binding and SIP domains n=1 Tax=Sulfitobacter marinus TaxID=394264 RepID=A0A1I6QT11_9RHOB|nr:siderophore-interacting protein [Sulfitobacter marinus]SFS55563.1 NADPH-dependent ferric siderophore reductase, contains FAD-binding and SIP domains [Sulfitobacter marinus]
MQKVTAETTIALAAPQALLGEFVAHMRDDHGMFFNVADDGAHSFENDGYRIELFPQDRGLRIRLEAPDEHAMSFTKEGIVHHVEEFDVAAAESIRWNNEQAQIGTTPENFRVLTVLKSEMLFDGMQRVTLHYPDIKALQSRGIHLRLILPCDPSRVPVWPVMGENGAPIWPVGADELHARYVTLKNIRADVEEVDIDIVRHGTGMISQWAQNASQGQLVGAMGPAGIRNLPEAKSYFLAADGTGLPAVAQLLSRLSQDAMGDVVVALPASVDYRSYLPETGLTVHTLSPDAFEENVVAMAERLTIKDTTGYAFFAGEFGNAQALRAHFKKVLGLDKTTQISATYWRRDR